MPDRPTAIVAEHSASVANVIAGAFVEAGFNVLGICGDGLSAMQLARAESPDVISLDLILPRFGGLQIAEALSGDQGPKIIAITAVNNRTRVAEAKRLGVSYYVLKPINRDKLMKALASLYADRAPRLRRVG